MRLRVIAGPNGSGKSSVFKIIKEFKESNRVINTGPFVNSDEIEKALRTIGSISLKEFQLDSVPTAFIDDYLKISTLKPPYDPREVTKRIRLSENKLVLIDGSATGHLGMVISDMIREELLRQNKTFTMETVFSHPDKINFMKRAIKNGSKVYLYFVSTENPELNVQRVKGRVQGGGHNVPEKKIRERYERTMNNLHEAVMISHRAFIFDNSGADTVLIAEKRTDGTISLESKVPEWLLKYLRVG